MKHNQPAKCVSTFLIGLMFISLSCTNELNIKQNGEVAVLKNELVSLEFNLAAGTYRILNISANTIPVKDAILKINSWTSDAENHRITWEKQSVSDTLGKGAAMVLKIEAPNQPGMIFRFTLYEHQGFLTVSGGIDNTTGQSLRVKEIHALAGGKVYDGMDISQDFAMVDGFSAGEPIEYGQRIYSPLTRENALKSRNNLLLTFGKDQSRQTLVMGGLTYADFEKFATLAQSRRVELEKGTDQTSSLLCYLNLPDDKLDQSAGGEKLELVQGLLKHTWQNHEFRCTETATSAKDTQKIIVDVKNLDRDKPYFLGFSWWRGLWHGDRKDHRQSVFAEYLKDEKLIRIPLIENKLLPRFDGIKKEDVEQVELAIPAEAIQSGEFQLVVEHASAAYENSAGDPNVYLNEVWLRSATGKPLLPGQLTPVNDCPRPKRAFTAQLFAADPVGKKVDPGTTYIPEDQFYIDVTSQDPFEALEQYGRMVARAQQVKLNLYDFPTVCLWYAECNEYGGGSAENTTLGAVKEMEVIAKRGFLKYSRAAVRLVPDSYLPDNQQGWWDDVHWQRETGPTETSKGGRHVEPYETSGKWGKAVTARGGIPLTYFQTGFRSEDYAKAFPEHMLFNKRFAWKGEPGDTAGELFTTWKTAWTRPGKLWGYDYTDPGFIKHVEEVYANLKSGGIKGLMFDYPFTGWASGGGMEDDYSTTAAAYRTIFRLPYEGLGPESYVDERNLDRGSDVSIGYVASMRTENDTDVMDGTSVVRCGLRWYKNRVLYSQDMDSKNIVRLEGNRDQVRALLTMAYVTSGRLLLANSFSLFSDQTYRDITRTFPYHAENRSARPVDAFVNDYPMVYDYPIDDQWHQVTFYNPDTVNAGTAGIALVGQAVNGALGLDADQSYHVYDFWNDHYIGQIAGSSRLAQDLRPGEARMMSVRQVVPHPQLLSTDRHIMQGYLDVENIQWNEKNKTLSGTSRVIGEDRYVITLASNGYLPESASTNDPDSGIKWSATDNGLIKIEIERKENAAVKWTVKFGKSGL